MLKLCENGSNIDYLYETSLVSRKATETEVSKGATEALHVKYAAAAATTIADMMVMLVMLVSLQASSRSLPEGVRVGRESEGH